MRMKKTDYRAATREDLESLWSLNITSHPEDNRWVHWKDEYIGYNLNGKAVTYAVVIDGQAVGEGTLLFSPDCRAIEGRTALADGVSVANVNALRIIKAYEGQGHISSLMRLMEREALARGYTHLTIGVDAWETRNLAIYLHWGYRDFVMAEEEDGDLVLYYAKDLKGMSDD